MDFPPDPPRPFGDLKNPLGHPAGPSGIFEIPSGLGGIWAKIPSTKSEFSIQILDFWEGYFENIWGKKTRFLDF